MHLLRAIHTQPDQKMVLAEKLAPGLIQEDAIGLHRMLDSNDWTRVLFDVVHCSLEKVQSHQGGFAALPGNGHFRGALRLDQLADIGFEQIITHAKAAVRVEFLLGKEKAVRAIEVACCARGFAQDMERGWCVLRPRSRKVWHGFRYCVCRC